MGDDRATIDFDDFLRFCRAHDGQTFLTRRRQAPFTLEVGNDGLYYTPASTGLQRHDSWESARRMHRHYSETASLNPGAYQGTRSRNASYYVAVLGECLDRGRRAD